MKCSDCGLFDNFKEAKEQLLNSFNEHPVKICIDSVLVDESGNMICRRCDQLKNTITLESIVSQ